MGVGVQLCRHAHAHTSTYTSAAVRSILACRCAVGNVWQVSLGSMQGLVGCAGSYKWGSSSSSTGGRAVLGRRTGAGGMQIHI